VGLDKIRRVVPEEAEQKIDIHTYWKIFWRKKYYLIVPVALSLVISIVGVRMLTPLYQSFTLLSIEDKNILEQTMGRYITAVEERSREMNMRYRAIIETRLQSRNFLESVVKDLGLERSPELLQAMRQMNGIDVEAAELERLLMRRLVFMLREKVSVDNPNSGFFRIGVYDTDPRTAYVLASTISEEFIESMRQARLQGIRQAGAFSDEQLAIYKEKLEASERELTEVRREMVDRNVESNPVSATNLHYAEALKSSLTAGIEQNEIALNRVRNRLVSIFDLVPSTDELSKDETVLNLENRLLAQGGEQLLHDLQRGQETESMDEQFGFLSEELRRSIGDIVNEEYKTFSSEIRPLITEYFFQQKLLGLYRSKYRRLQGYIDQHRMNTKRMPILEREYDRLSGEVETSRAIYQAFLESKTSAQITEAIQNTNLGFHISIVEKADMPLGPVKPEPLKIILVALLFGASCGIGSILVTEYMDDSFRNVEEVQRFLKIPVLGTVPKTVSSFSWERKKRGKAILFWIIGLFLFVMIVTATLFIYEKSLRQAGIGVRISDSRG
jgi:succinoglycan biosynthesis transport protein ExoP